jgi:hypothetical protein
MVPSIDYTRNAESDWSSSLQLFFYLQLLDILTTLLGIRLGLSEASPFIQFLMRFGVLGGLLASKIVAFAIGGFCVWRRRFRVIGMVNYWYATLVIWNLALIVSR